MKAIVTKYHGPTNFKGSRITATDEDGNRITISYPHELSGEEVHRAAAQALCDKMNWAGSLVGGSLKNGYVFTFGPANNQEIAAEMLEALELAAKYVAKMVADNVNTVVPPANALRRIEYVIGKAKVALAK